jgi:hypothetical protein
MPFVPELPSQGPTSLEILGRQGYTGQDSDAAWAMAAGMAWSANPVLSNPEILENILLGLDEVTLLCKAQRVCRLWHDLVNTSPRLQRKLYLKPVEQAQAINAAPRQNPMLVKLFFYEFDVPAHCKPGYTGEKLPRDETIPFPTATLRSLIFTYGKFAIMPNRFFYKDASWRRMLVQQPCITTLGQIVMERSRGRRVGYHGLMTFEDGLRMGPLFDTLQQRLRHEDDDRKIFYRLAWFNPCKQFIEERFPPMMKYQRRMMEEDGAGLVLEFAEYSSLESLYADGPESLYTTCVDNEATRKFDAKTKFSSPEPLKFKMEPIDFDI